LGRIGARCDEWLSIDAPVAGIQAPVHRYETQAQRNEGEMDKTRLVWMDLEMTGLDPLHDRIIEIATVVTDAGLNVLATGPELAIRQTEAQLATMDEWNQTTHGNSGLLERVRTQGVSEAEAETQTLDFLRHWVPAKTSPLCGNTICQDRRFLALAMPRVLEHLHYRNLDVSTLKELSRVWQPSLPAREDKKAAHTALSDILESIEELRYYRQHWLR
jgi:oligoribonuclease